MPVRPTVPSRPSLSLSPSSSSLRLKWLQSKNTLDFLHPYQKRTINIMRFRVLSTPDQPLPLPCLFSLCMCVCARESVGNIANVICLLGGGALSAGNWCRMGLQRVLSPLARPHAPAYILGSAQKFNIFATLK